MKAKSFFLIIVFVLSLFSRNSYANEESADTLYVKGGGLKFDEGGKAMLIPPEELVCTGDGILSYNLTTKEIIFTDSIFDKIRDIYQVFNIYLNDTLLLENILQTSAVMSWPIIDLVLFFDNPKFYLPWWDNYLSAFGDDSRDEKEKKLAENLEKRKAGWDIFIQYLSDAGKIVGDVGINGVKTELPIQIYGSGKTIYVDNQTGKEAVVSVYGIDGIKVTEQKMISQTTTMEMPVSGFYLVSVKAENEKPVTAKLIVK